MKVMVAKYAGFCFGVKRAVDLAEHAVNDSEQKVYSYGEIIHNPQVTERLREKGIKVVEDTEEAKGNTLIIRSHGVSEDILQKAEQGHSAIIDATCPFVKKIQKIVRQRSELGHHILIIGDPHHPEVVGLKGWCRGSVEVLSSLDDLYQLSIQPGEYTVVSQTTTSTLLFDELEKAIKKIIPQAEIYNTICAATEQRQEEALSLSQQVDAMVVIGGTKSSNTKKLAEITSKNCQTFLVETVEELDLVQLDRYEVVGVTAGASTPDFVINEVINFLKYL